MPTVRFSISDNIAQHTILGNRSHEYARVNHRKQERSIPFRDKSDFVASYKQTYGRMILGFARDNTRDETLTIDATFIFARLRHRGRIDLAENQYCKIWNIYKFFFFISRVFYSQQYRTLSAKRGRDERTNEIKKLFWGKTSHPPGTPPESIRSWADSAFSVMAAAMLGRARRARSS